jgi:hypothetical protein
MPTVLDKEFLKPCYANGWRNVGSTANISPTNMVLLLPSLKLLPNVGNFVGSAANNPTT